MPKAAPPRPVPTYDHLRKKAPLEHVVRVPLSEDAVVAHTEAVKALGRAELALKPLEDAAKAGEEPSPALLAARAERYEAKATAADAKAGLQDQTVVMRFRSIGRQRYDDLMREHPPKDDIGEDGKPVKSTDPYDAETFAPALVAASCVEPRMTYAQVMALFDLDRLGDEDLRAMVESYELKVPEEATHADLVVAVRDVAPEWNSAEVMELWIAALACNTQRRVVDFANFSNGMHG